MANIALISLDTTHNAVTSCRDALQSGGHTVTMMTQANALTADFSTYDLVVTSRQDGGGTGRKQLATLLNDLNEKGKPLIVGPIDTAHTVAVASTSSVLTEMGLTGNVALASGQTIVNVGSPSDHSIRGSVALGNNTLFTSGNWIASVASGQTYIGTGFIAGTASNVSGLPVAVAIESGTNRINSYVWTGNRIVIFPTYLLTGAYRADHTTLLLNAVSWALAGVVTAAPPAVRVSALVAYAVMDFPGDAVGVSALVAYAVMTDDGIPRVGDTLGYRYDAWLNGPTSYTYQWFRDGVAIPGATNAQYVIASGDVGGMIHVEVTGVNSFGAGDTAASDPVGPVQ